MKDGDNTSLSYIYHICMSFFVGDCVYGNNINIRYEYSVLRSIDV